MNIYGKCPACGVSWDRGLIFDELRKLSVYADQTDEQLREMVKDGYGDEAAHFSRLIGVETRDLDCITKWQCPDCKTEFPVSH